MANGEYTAASVDGDQKDALSLGLVKEKDGNYGTTSQTTSGASSQSASSALTALAALRLGG
jgi:hypothetical protein